MELPNGPCEGRQVVRVEEAFRKRVVRGERLISQGGLNDASEPSLIKAFGEGVNRHEAAHVEAKIGRCLLALDSILSGQGRVVCCAVKMFDLRMDDLQPTARRLNTPVDDQLLTDPQELVQ